MKKINLGCESKILEGYENYDISPIDNKVKYLDFDNLPFDFIKRKKDSEQQIKDNTILWIKHFLTWRDE